MLIFWVMGSHTGRIVTQWPYCKIRIEGDKPTFNPYFPKYLSSDALPAPEIFENITWSSLIDH